MTILNATDTFLGEVDSTLVFTLGITGEILRSREVHERPRLEVVPGGQGHGYLLSRSSPRVTDSVGVPLQCDIARPRQWL